MAKLQAEFILLLQFHQGAFGHSTHLCEKKEKEKKKKKGGGGGGGGYFCPEDMVKHRITDDSLDNDLRHTGFFIDFTKGKAADGNYNNGNDANEKPIDDEKKKKKKTTCFKALNPHSDTEIFATRHQRAP